MWDWTNPNNPLSQSETWALTDEMVAARARSAGVVYILD